MAEFVQIDLPGQPIRTLEHRGTDADRGVVQQILVSQDYSLDALARGEEIRAHYNRLTGAGTKPLIIDAGANIGASVVYFCMNFPQAHVLALEPAPDNFELLVPNTAGLDVDARRAGIAATTGHATLRDPGLGEWGYRTERDGGDGPLVELCAAADLVAAKTKQGFAPFIAKIDIEGGEDELFSSATDWVDEFPLIIIELHDWLFPRRANSRNFLQCIARRDRDFIYLGENVFSVRNT